MRWLPAAGLFSIMLGRDQMKDSSVGPTQLLSARRCGRLIHALGQRMEAMSQQRHELQGHHVLSRAEEEAVLADQRGTVTQQCRESRRQMLTQWDQAEEQLTSDYERRAVTGRSQLNRLTLLFRQKKAEEVKTIDRKVEARHQAVLQQYENRKNQPGQQRRKEIKLVDESLGPIVEQIELARELTVRRLDGLPEVGPAEDSDQDMSEPASESAPETVNGAIDTVAVLTRKCKQIVADMQTGTASKADSVVYLPIVVAVLVVLWCMASVLMVKEHPYIWALAGTVAIGVLGIFAYLILLMPLRKMTRRLYPQVERLGMAANQAAEAGREIAKQTAIVASQELVDRRHAHLEAAQRWRKEHLAALEERLEKELLGKRQHFIHALEAVDKDYSEKIQVSTGEMRAKAETVAQAITATLAKADQTLHQQRETTAAQRFLQQQHLANRLKDGVKDGLRRIQTATDQVAGEFPDWSDLIQKDLHQSSHPGYLPVGSLQVADHLAALVQCQTQPSETAPDLLADVDMPATVPIVIHRRCHSAIVITADEASMEEAIKTAHQVLWRLLTSAAPAKTKLTLMDPLGRGQHFTSFMALADHDPSIVGHRVWTTDDKIEARLSELAHHVEDILQSSLRDRFERIEDYNELAGSMAEPYRAIAAVGFPDGLSREGYQHLQAIIKSGLRCGILTVLVCDASQPWPSDMPVPSGDKVLSLEVTAKEGWRVTSEDLRHLPFVPATAPTAELRVGLVENIGAASVEAAKVEIPIDNILSGIMEGKGTTDQGISIAIGSQGANRSLALELGEGVRQHVLIAGKTGSGKSTLLHSIITSGAYRYRPDQLQFYLLDFKKGVEFKVYAESQLPHARVIGIESEREFGRSVLQRLDKELQERGEAFRAANVQELQHYRQASGKPMPRIMLVIDEFQELFVRDDRMAGDCSLLLDRLVRQGRSFGIHVILSSQSLAGAYSLPRATLGQMAVRIAMQCSEADAAMILSDDNTAARLISRPGEAIYNDAAGLVEGNQPFQVAWLTPQRHREILHSIAARDLAERSKMPPPVIFEGNRPCRWTPALADAAADPATASGITGLLGESVEIGPPVAITLARDTGRNLLVVASGDARLSVAASTIASFAKSSTGPFKVIHFDGSRVDDGNPLGPWLEATGITTETIKPRESEAEMVRLSQWVKERGDEAAEAPPVLVVIDPVERFRDLRQDESFNFSLDAPEGQSGGAALQTVLKDGPAAGVFVMAICGGAETLSRWFPRSSQHDMERRVLGQMNASDSSFLIDAPTASDLSTATMLAYDHADGRVTKFRQCALPDPKEVKTWLMNH